MRSDLRVVWAMCLALLCAGCEPEKPRQAPVCNRYVSCTELSGESIPTGHYATNGSCWKGSAERASSCTRACEQALKDFTARTGFCQ